MKHDVPITHAHRATPAPAPGLTLAAAGVHDERGAWLHGTLVVPDDAHTPDVATALRSVGLVTISQVNQVPLFGQVLRQAAFLRPLAWEPVKVDGDRQLRACFSVHTSWIFEYSLHFERQYVYATAGGLLSAALELAPGDARPVEPGPLAGDALLHAYDLALRSQWEAATKAFEVALALPAVAADLDGAHAYNAACAAALAARALPASRAEEARPLEARAAEWIRQDLRARAEAHTDAVIERALAAKDGGEPAPLDSALHDHLRHLHADPDLAALRGTGAFDLPRRRQASTDLKA